MLIKYLAKKWPYLAAYLVLVVITPIVNANGTFLYSDMMDYVGAGEFNAFLKTLWTFLGFFFLHGGLLFLVQTLRIRLISFCLQDLKQDMFEKIMHTDNAFFKNDLDVVLKSLFAGGFKLCKILCLADADG